PSPQATTFAASRSTCSIFGGSASSSLAFFIRAAAIGPERCALRPFSSGKASKIPNSAGPKRSANQTGVCVSLWAAGRAPARNFATSASLPGLARRRTSRATLTMASSFEEPLPPRRNRASLVPCVEPDALRERRIPARGRHFEARASASSAKPMRRLHPPELEAGRVGHPARVPGRVPHHLDAHFAHSGDRL